MPTDKTVVTIAPGAHPESNKHTPSDPSEYLDTVQEVVNEHFTEVDVVDGKVVIEYEGGGGTHMSATRHAKRIAESGDRVAVVSFSEEGWGRGDAYKALQMPLSDVAQFSEIGTFDGEDGADGEDVRERIEERLGVKPARAV